MPSSIINALRNPIAAVGMGLTTASALLFVFLVAAQTVGVLQGPYVGLVVFVMAPALFVLGLLIIPIGWSLERRRRKGHAAPAWPRLDLNDPAIRRTLFFVGIATIVNLAIVSIASFGAVEYTESSNFCGQVCHEVMEPEFVSHAAGPHGRIGCAACHVGRGAEGFLSSKLSGTRRLGLVLTGSYPRPVPTPVADFPGVQGSCESCHRPDRFIGDVIRVAYEHADDQANTASRTVLRLHVGGPFGGTGTGSGIHWHMNRGNQVEYVALDDEREQIPYVRVTTPSGEVREYFAEGSTPAEIEGRPRRRMDCLDCHSRPSHPFASSPEREVDRAIGEGRISGRIPFIRRESVRALTADYPSREVAFREIERSIREAVPRSDAPSESDGLNAGELDGAIAVTQDIYRTNVFPAMKVTWGTYRNQTGHLTSTGCFRCHDDSHKTSDGKAISQDCALCHEIE